MLSELQSSWSIATDKLESFLQDKDLEKKLKLAFGNDIEISLAKSLIQSLIEEKEIPVLPISLCQLVGDR